MGLKTQVAKRIGQIAFAPLSLLKSRTIGNAVYRKGLQWVIDTSEQYAVDATVDSSRPLPEFYRPASAFESRFDQVALAAKECNARNILDIGCAEGYMIRRASKELGLLGLGLEMDRKRIRVGNATSELDADINYGIIPCSACPNLFEHIPIFDVVVCFSVLHHVIRHEGIDEAIEFLRSIRKITKHRFLFDMGGPNETANDPVWGKVLSFLSDDVVGKNKELLESAGFTDIRHVSDTAGYIQTELRPLFICSVPGAD